MGSWDVKPFENDAAGDFVAEFPEKGWELVKATINRQVSRDEMTEQEVVAACEFVAAAKGYKLRGETLEELNDWLEEHSDFRISAELVARSIEHLEALSMDSALLVAWTDAGLEKEWLKTIQNLIERLQKPAKKKKGSHCKTSFGKVKPRPNKERCKKCLENVRRGHAKAERRTNRQRSTSYSG